MTEKFKVCNIINLGSLKMNEKKDDSGTLHYLDGFDEITVKEVHFYTYKKYLIGFQFFYLYSDSSITNGLTTDLPDEFHDKLISLGCSDEDCLKCPKGFFKYSIDLVLDKYSFSSKQEIFGEFSVTIEKSIFRPNLAECEFVQQISTYCD